MPREQMALGLEGCGYKPRGTEDGYELQELEEAQKESSLEPYEKVQPGPHLEFGLLASRTARECIAAVLHPVYGTSLWKP